MVRDHDNVFASDDPMTGCTADYPAFDIEWEDESKPCWSKPRPVIQKEDELLDAHWADMLRKGYIEKAPQGARHANPLVVVAKKLPDGTWGDVRICLDVRKSNKRTTRWRHRTELPETMCTRISSTRGSQACCRRWTMTGGST
jgi:hypothetical protein